MSTDEPEEGRFVAPHPPPSRPGRTGGKRHANRLKRIEALCDGAIPLFLEHGLAMVRIDDVTTAAGVSKGSFYRYFESKEELVATVLQPLADGVRSALDRGTAALERADDAPTLSAAYGQIAADLVPLLLSHPDVVRLFLQERAGPWSQVRAPIRQLADDVTAYALRMTQIAQDHGLLAPVDPRVSALAVVGAIQELLLRALSGEDIGDPQAAATTLIGIVLDGMRGERAR